MDTNNNGTKAMTNHIDQIIERECGKYANDNCTTAMNPSRLRKVLEEAIAPYKKDTESIDWTINHYASCLICNDGRWLVVYIEPETKKPIKYYASSLREALAQAQIKGDIEGQK